MTNRRYFLLATLAALACTDAPTTGPDGARAISGVSDATRAVHDVNETSSVRWNRMAITLFRARGGPAGRMTAYLSLAQYRAVLAAVDAKHGTTRPSPAGAAAGASAVVLSQFFPLDVTTIDGELALQRAEPPLGTEHNKDFAAGEALGRAVGAAVLAQAATDNVGATPAGTPPVGPGYWVSSGAPIVTGGLGARPFFLTSGSEFRSPPPPAFGSAAFQAGLAEVRAISDTRTAEQVAIARKWVPFSGVVFNGTAAELIGKYHRSELEAARLLAYANTAAFDAIISCFGTKFTYWFLRPTQADPQITLAVGLPNHPSYPSAHSCETGAFHGILEVAFPAERAMLDALAQEASMSRVYGGIHFRFDGEAGLALGRAVARAALERGGID
jgi:hypothetical protein